MNGREEEFAKIATEMARKGKIEVILPREGEFHFSSSIMTGVIMENPGIKSFHIEGIVQVTLGKVFDALGECKWLQELRIINCDLDDIDMDAIEKLLTKSVFLRVLVIKENEVTVFETLPSVLKKFNNLEVCELSLRASSSIFEQCIDSLTDLHNLKKIKIVTNGTWVSVNNFRKKVSLMRSIEEIEIGEENKQLALDADITKNIREYFMRGHAKVLDAEEAKKNRDRE